MSQRCEVHQTNQGGADTGVPTERRGVKFRTATTIIALFVLSVIIIPFVISSGSAGSDAKQHHQPALPVDPLHTSSSLGANIVASYYMQWITTAVDNYTAAVAAFQAQQAAERAAAQVAQVSAASSTTTSGDIPAAWWPTALCEEGGRDDANYGYFGIKEWNGFDGYPTAGSAPLDVQMAWEAAHGQGPPDAPGQCHSY